MASLKKIRLVILAVVIVALQAAGCTLYNQPAKNPPPGAASVASSETQHCPDRVERARTGSFVGTVLGTLITSLIGSPLIGGIYQAAGLVMGFASAGSCDRQVYRGERSGSPEGPRPLLATHIREEDLRDDGVRP